MEVIGLSAKDKNVPAFAILIGGGVADDDASLIVWIKKETRAQRESFCIGKLREIIVIDIVFVLIVDGTEKRVAKTLKLSRVEDRKISAERGSLIEDDRSDGSVFRFLADKIDHACDCAAA